MMYLCRVHCLLLIFLVSGEGVVFTKFSRCDIGGFTCVTDQKTKNQIITYRCPEGTNDVSFMINDFNCPTNIQTFTIRDCNKLTITTRCTGNVRNIQVLSIQNIKLLTIERMQYTSHVPLAVVLENIGFIETIPSFTFAQIQKNTHSVGCSLPKADFEMIKLKNVAIDTIQQNAIFMRNNSGSVTFDGVRINRLQNSAINIKLKESATFSFTNSTVDVVEHLAFQVIGESVNFMDNKFVDIESGGINGTMENFRFFNNTVNTLQPNSISILAEKVKIAKNRFGYLKSGAFERIGPGLLRDSGKNFGKLRFIYEFVSNFISFTDAASLQPDMVSYDNVANDMTIEKNQFYCSCENLGWLFSGVGHGYNTPAVSGYYDYILNPQYQNNCSYSSCNISVASLRNSIKDLKCIENFDLDDLCVRHTTSTVSTNVGKSKAMPGDKKSNNVNRIFLLKNSSSGTLASSALIAFLICTLVTIHDLN